MIVIVDYGMGNLGSLLNMLRRVGVRARVSTNVTDVAEAEKVILPGVGAFDAAMERIDTRPGLRAALNTAALERRIPVLGVCLGMQLLVDRSEEGERRGLGWIPGVARRFESSATLKVPHMGWNVATPVASVPLLTDVGPEPRYYFVHSFYVQVANRASSWMTTNYSITFDAAIGSGNIMGVQFHPEKSHRFGMKLLENFASL
jgi:glutamine amidotransferase